MSEYVIGKFYMVPCIKPLHPPRNMRGWIPIIGPLHEDREFLKFPEEHYHIDWRFVSASQWKSTEYSRAIQPGYEYAIVTSARLKRLGHPVEDNITEPPRMMRRRCNRAFGAYPNILARWMQELIDAHKECRLKPGLICPHKGVPLHGIPGDIVTCPGHGLRWNVKTGELVSPSGGSRQQEKI